MPNRLDSTTLLMANLGVLCGFAPAQHAIAAAYMSPTALSGQEISAVNDIVTVSSEPHRLRLESSGHIFYVPSTYFQGGVAALNGLMTITFPDYSPVPENKVPCFPAGRPVRRDKECFRIDFWLDATNKDVASTVEAFNRNKSRFRKSDPQYIAGGFQMYREGPDSAGTDFYTWQSDGRQGAADCISYGPLDPWKGSCLDKVELIPKIMVTIRVYEVDIGHIREVERAIQALLKSFDSK